MTDWQGTPGSADEASASPGSRILGGIRVLDLTRLAPGPYATMLLADMGAEVIVVGGGRGSLPIPALCRGKRFMRLDLKSEAGHRAFRRLAATADVLIEGFRPGVADRLEIGFEALRAENRRLIFCSLTGYGQDGPLARTAGHDINYIAVSGALGSFGPTDDVPTPPLNLLADFAGGSLLTAFGIVAALYERERSGEGQYIDAAMVDGCVSMMAMHFPDWGRPVLADRGDGLVAGTAPFYRCYACADGRFVAVGALERAFFEQLWSGLGFADPPPASYMDRSTWPAMTERFERAFRDRPRDAWVEHFRGCDACLSPVLSPAEALADPHLRHRHPGFAEDRVPAVPLFSRTPAVPPATDFADRSAEILRSLGLSEAEIEGAVPPDEGGGTIGGLVWPPVRQSGAAG